MADTKLMVICFRYGGIVKRNIGKEDGPWHTTFTINGNVMKTTEAGETTWYKK